jgi:hypothetical protein
MRELNKDIWDSIRNRNLATERLGIKGFTGKVPVKYDILNGQPLRDWNFFESVFNAVSPVHFSLKPSPGRNLLHTSQYDLRTTVTSAPAGVGFKVDLNKSNVARSLFQKAIGSYKDSKGRNLEEILNDYADPKKNPDIAKSIAIMNADRAKGKDHIDPMTYEHNILIAKLFETAKSKAWAQIQDHPEIIRLVQKGATQLEDNLDAKERSIDASRNNEVEILNWKNK